MRGPCAFEARGDGVATDATGLVIHPAQALLLDVRTLRLGAEVRGTAVAVGLADGVAAGGERDGLFIIHRHAGERGSHVVRRAQRVGLAVDALGVDVDEAHLHRGQRILQRFAIAALVAVLAQPVVLGAPVDVEFGMPDVLATEGETEGLEAHGLVGDVAGEDVEVGPAQRVAVLLLDRPQQTPGLVEVAVVRPGVQWREALVAGAATATAVSHAVGAGGVPGHADHEPAVVTPVRRPPFLGVGHEVGEVLLQCGNVERAHGLAVAEAGKRVGLGVVLMQDLQLQRVRPPVGGRGLGSGVGAVCDGALACFSHRVLLTSSTS